MTAKTFLSFFLSSLLTTFCFQIDGLEAYPKNYSISNELSDTIPDDLDWENYLRAQGHTHHHWYNVHSSHEKKFVWFRVFKVASGTIRGVLKKQVSDLTQSRPSKVPEEFRDYFKFAFVRNPWSRIVSCYFHKIVTKKAREFQDCFGKDFDYFVDYISRLDVTKANPHIKLQTRLIPVKQCHFIGKLDNFAEDLKYVCDILGIEMGELKNKHRTEHAHYSTYYTPRTKQIIAGLYKEDIETFGFTFETK